jgi:hypothetical protein
VSNYLSPKTSFKVLFLDALEASLKRNNLSCTDETKAYLVGLFADSLISNYMESPNFVLVPFIFGLKIPNDQDLLLETKKMSDYITIHLGYFPESLTKNKFFSIEDYFSLGRYSFYNLHRRRPGNVAYKELSYNYPEIIFLLNETMDSIRKYDQKEIMITYNCWNQTRHVLFEKKLIRLGFNPSDISE